MKHRSVLARHRLRCALWCGVFLASFVASCSTVFSCQMPSYDCGLIDLNGKAIGTADKLSFQYLGDGVFSYYLRGNRTPITRHICNREGKEISLSFPDGWVPQDIFVPHPGKCLDKTVSELPPNTLIALRNEKEHRLVTSAGEELIAARKEHFYCDEINGIYIFSDEYTREFGCVEKPPLIAYDPASGRKYTGEDIETYVYKRKIPFKKIDQNLVNDSVMKVNHLEDKFKRVHFVHPQFMQLTSKPFTFEPTALDGWNNDLAVVGCETFDEGKWKYGIINRQYEFVLPPTYASLKYLCGDIYLGKLKKNGYCEAITHDGKPLKLLPQNTVDAYASQDLILCEQNQLESVKLGWVRMIDQNGRVLQSVSGARVSGFMKGIAVLETNDWDYMWHEDVLAILTKGGITCKDIPACWAVPVSDNELILGRLRTEFGPMYSANDNFFFLCSVPAEIHFVYKLRQNDLIGMSKEEMDKLFVIPASSGTTITLVPIDSEQNSNQIEFRYSDNKLQAWRWINRRRDKETFGPWIENNVVIDWRPFGRYRSSSLVDWRTVKIEPKVVATQH